MISLKSQQDNHSSQKSPAIAKYAKSLCVGIRHWKYAILGFFLSSPTFAAWDLDLKEPVTPIAREIFDLHRLILYICVVIFVVVFGFMFYSIYKHRKSKGHKAAQFHDNVLIEVVWTVIPVLILVAMAIPSTLVLLKMEDTSEFDITVKVTGYQWKWHYNFPEYDVAYYSNLSTPRAQIENQETKGEHYLLEVDQPMIVPVGKKIRILLTSNDVLHAWWVPELGVKKDAIPGFISQMWTYIDKPGTYRGQCAELCGKDHGFMPIVVKAVSNSDFEQWMQAQNPG